RGRESVGPCERQARQHRPRARRWQLGAARAGDSEGGTRPDPGARTVRRLGRPEAARLERPRDSRLGRELHAVLPPAAPDGSERAVDPLLRLRPERLSRRAGGLGGLARRARHPEAPVVTVRALAGLAALNVAYAVVGLSLLWAALAFRTWGGLRRLAGRGYLLGLAAFGVLWTALLVAGVPFGVVVVVLSLVVLTAGGPVGGRLQGARVQTERRRLSAA